MNTAQTGAGEFRINLPFPILSVAGIGSSSIPGFYSQGGSPLPVITALATARALTLRDAAGQVHATAPVTFVNGDILQLMFIFLFLHPNRPYLRRCEIGKWIIGSQQQINIVFSQHRHWSSRS